MMDGQLIGTSVGTPLIVSQDASTSKVTWANINSSINSGNKSVAANVDEPMLDWKSLEFLGLVEEYVSAVIKGEKTTSTVGSTNSSASSSTTTTTTPNASSDTVLVGTDGNAAFPADTTAASALSHVKYATSGPPEVIFSGVKSATPTSEIATQKATPSTLFVMKNVGPNGSGSTEMAPGSTTALMGQLGAAAASMGPLGTAVAPLSSFGNVASFGDLATFLPMGTALPLGTTLIASPLNVDGTPSLQNVTFTVRDDMSIIQPTVLAQAPVQAISTAAGQQNLEQFHVANDFNYQVDYIVNDELSRDGLSPDGSFESSSLSLSVGDPSPSSDDGSAENLSDVIILSQTHPPNLATTTTTTTAMFQHGGGGVGWSNAGVTSMMPVIQQAATSSSANASLLSSSINDPTLFSRVVQPSLSLQQPQQRQQQHHQSPLQSKLSEPSATTPGTAAVGASSIGLKSPFLSQATLANALKVHNMSVASQQRAAEGLPTQALPTQSLSTQGLPTQGLPTQGLSTQGLPTQALPTQGLSTQGLSTQGLSTQGLPTQGLSTQGVSSMGTQMGLTPGNASLLPKGGLTKVKARRSQTKHVPEESLPFPCEVCGRRFVSMHSVKRHMAIHDLDRPWKCEVCQKCFKQQAHLYSHKFTHTGSKPFECTMCHKSFNVKSNLHRHEKEVCKVPLESRTPTRSK